MVHVQCTIYIYTTYQHVRDRHHWYRCAHPAKELRVRPAAVVGSGVAPIPTGSDQASPVVDDEIDDEEDDERVCSVLEDIPDDNSAPPLEDEDEDEDDAGTGTTGAPE